MALRVTTTQVRPHLTALLGAVQHGGEKVIILRHGKPAAALVSMEDLKRIWKDEDIDLYGPINPATGRRRGAAWVKATGWVRPKPEGPAPERRRGWWPWRRG